MRKNRHWLLTMAMLLCSITVSAHDFEVDGIYYNILSSSDRTVEVTYSDDCSNPTSFIASRVDYSGSVVIPKSVTYNGLEYAVIALSNYAFNSCQNMTDITIPTSVTDIGTHAFQNCSGLSSIVLPTGIGAIKERTFNGCYNLENVNIPVGVTSIGLLAFADCQKISDIVVPEGVTSIGNGAFGYCRSLGSITIPSTVKSLGTPLFECCDNLESIIVASSNTVFDSRNNCNAIIKTVNNSLLHGSNTTVIPNDVVSIGDYAFSGRLGFNSIVIPKSVTKIGSNAFSFCSDLQSVVMSEGVTSIGSNSFYLCSSLTSITIPASVVSWGNSAFAYCSNLKSITLSEGVKGVGSQAFYKCSGLTSITIPRSMTSVGDYAFNGCGSLTSVISLSPIAPTIVDGAFGSISSSAILTIPSGSTASYEDAGWTSSFSSVVEMENILATSLALDVTEASLKPCETLTLTATLLPEDVTNPVLTWTSGNEAVATVDANGVVTAVADGEAAITVSTTDGSELSASCKVTVKTVVLATSLALDVTEASLEPSETLTLTATLLPEDVTNPALTWASSDEAVATVDANGVVTAVADGEATITVCTTDGSELSASCKVIVKTNILATSLALDVAEASLEPSETLALTATLLPEDVTNPALVWTSSNETVAMVDANGVVTAVADGEATITVCTTDGSELSASCKVTVKTIVLATSLALGVTEASLEPSETLALSATLLPEDVTNPALEWTSSNEAVATVDANGVVTAVADGEATITVSTTDGSELSASCKVMVKTIVLATSLALDVTEVSLAPNETLTLTATLLPEDVTNPALEWTSSDEAVATVDANGVVTAVADGEATLTVSTTDGSELSATCKVTVKTEVVVEYENKIYFEDVTVFSNSSVSHPLQLKNTVNMTAVQFDLYLPEGITLATDARGRYAITFNADRADNTTHTLSSALQSDGAIRVLCYSVDSYEFLGSEGAIFNFPLEISEMEDGDYDMVIKNIVLTDVSGTKYEIPSMTSTITVLNVAPGDCNGDKTIDVADIVVLANSILGNTADGFVEKAADYNADGAVDVADIVNIANYILNGNASNARGLMRAALYANEAVGYSFDILPFVLAAEESKTITLDLASTEATFTAFQCDLYLPDGVCVDKNTRGKYAFSFNEERTDASCHVLSSALQSDGAIRVLCYSQDTYNFLGTEGALLNIPLTADASLANGVYEFSIAQTVLTYVSGEKVSPETYKGSIVVGDGGKVEEVKLYGRYTSEVLNEYTTAFGTNDGITCLDLTEAIYLAEGGLLATGNPNTIVYLAEGDALANESNVVSGDECASLVLTDGYAFSASVPFNASQASYERELVAGKYGTIVLPFAPNTDDYVFYALTSATDDMLTFDEVTNPVANTPYLYKLRDGKSATQITNSEVAVSSELTSVGTPVWQMVGSFTNQTIAAGEDEENSYYVYTSSDNQVHQVTNTLTVKPYRAYFTTSSANNMQLAVRTRGGEETLIDATEVDGLCPEVYYDLSGRRVDNPTKGVYIVNGKKVVF